MKKTLKERVPNKGIIPVVLTIIRSGPPPKYKNADEIYKLAKEYFFLCNISKEPYTVTGLAIALDTNRKTLCEWEKQDTEIGNAIKKTKAIVENYAERHLFSPYMTGAIFALKNFDWTDKHEIIDDSARSQIESLKNELKHLVK